MRGGVSSGRLAALKIFIRRNGTESRSHRRTSINRVELLELRNLLDGLSWSVGPALPAAIGNANALNTSSGVLVVGGTTNSSGTATTASAHLLDPISNLWMNAPTAVRGVNAGGIGATGSYGPIVGGGNGDGGDYKYVSDIFQFGGATQGHATASVSNYDLYGTGEVPTVPSMSVARYEFAYATDPETGDLYAIGGLASTNAALSSVERYDPAADAWTSIAPLPQPLYRASAAADGAGHILVFGGDNSSGVPVGSVYSYTIASGAWSVVATMPVPTAASAAVYGAYGQIYVVGGLTPSGATSNVLIFNPVTDQWTSDALLPTAEYGAMAVIDSNGVLDVIGGFNSAGTPVNNVYQSPALPAPEGLPTVPTIIVDGNWFSYDGTPHAATAYAVGADGITSIDGTFKFTYDGSATPPTNAGTYDLLATFTSNDPQYVDTVVDTTQYIAQATPSISLTGGGTITYDGLPHGISATVVGVDAVTPVSGTIAYAYNGSASCAGKSRYVYRRRRFYDLRFELRRR